MVSVFSMLAEVADKEFSVATLWLVAAAIAVASFALCRWRRWAAFIVLPVAAILALAAAIRDSRALCRSRHPTGAWPRLRDPDLRQRGSAFTLHHSRTYLEATPNHLTMRWSRPRAAVLSSFP